MTNQLSKFNLTDREMLMRHCFSAWRQATQSANLCSYL